MTARPPLTRRQADVLAAIRTALAADPVAPTLGEIGELVGLSAATVHHHVVRLEAKGYLRRPRGYGDGLVGGSPVAATRAFVLLDSDAQAMPAPLRLLRTPAILRIADPDAAPPGASAFDPATGVCVAGHARTAGNRWFVACGEQADLDVAGVELCRACGQRAAVADHLARKVGT